MAAALDHIKPALVFVSSRACTESFNAVALRATRGVGDGGVGDGGAAAEEEEAQTQRAGAVRLEKASLFAADVARRSLQAATVEGCAPPAFPPPGPCPKHAGLRRAKPASRAGCPTACCRTSGCTC